MPANVPAQLRDEDLRRHRAAKMIELRITNHSLEQIGEKFNLTAVTIGREIQWYVRNGFLADAESDILSLTGEAIRVYKAKLKLNDLDAAKHVLDIAVKLGDRFQKQGHQEAELGLRAYMAAKREKDNDPAANAKVVEGSVVRINQPEQPRIAETASASSVVGVGPVESPAEAGAVIEPALEFGVQHAEGSGSSPHVGEEQLRNIEDSEDEE